MTNRKLIQQLKDESECLEAMIDTDTIFDTIDSAISALEAMEWQDIETAPKDEDVLLYCPDLGCPTNRERIELRPYSTGERVGNTSTMSYHSWATKWMPLPPIPIPPEAE